MEKLEGDDELLHTNPTRQRQRPSLARRVCVLAKDLRKGHLGHSPARPALVPTETREAEQAHDADHQRAGLWSRLDLPAAHVEDVPAVHVAVQPIADQRGSRRATVQERAVDGRASQLEERAYKA